MTLIQPSSTPDRGPSSPHRRPGRVAALLVAVLAASSLLAACGGGGKDEATTTTTAGADANAQQKAMEAAERMLSTVRLPGAVGYFAKSTKACPSGQFPQVTRTDASEQSPDEVVAELTDLLEEDGWTYEHLSDGRETYVKEPYQVWVTATEVDGGGTSATVEVRTSELTCP